MLAARRALQVARNASVALTATRALSSVSQATPLSVLVIDGYSKEGREDLQAGGASTAGKLYQELLKKCTPKGNVVADIVYPADEDFATPDLSKVRIAHVEVGFFDPFWLFNTWCLFVRV